MELIKRTVRVGNSAGVLLPKKWLHSQVKVVLSPLNIERDVLDILIEENVLNEILGVYLIGSYSRGEQTIESDVDILVITTDLEKRIKKEKYDLLLVAEKTLERQLDSNIMPLLPMIKEAKTIINKSLLESYKNSKLTRKNLRWHIEIIRSGLKVSRAALNLENEVDSKYASDAVAYSLVFYLRSLYIVESLMKNKKWNNKDLINLVKKITGSKLAYEGYVRVKANRKREKRLPLDQAEKLHEYISNKLKDQEKSI